MHIPLLHKPRNLPFGVIAGGALIVTAGLVQAVADNWVLTGVLVCGAVSFFLASRALLHIQRTEEPREEVAVQDWSVTAAAIASPNFGIAITDSSDSLVCANTLFQDWFGHDNPPSSLFKDSSSQHMLHAGMSAAWRDGASSAIAVTSEGASWTVAIQRAGRGDSHLIWQFQKCVPVAPTSGMLDLIRGAFGHSLTAAGVEIALVGADGSMIGATAGFIKRALGDAGAPHAGMAFASLLRTDEHEQIYYAREGRAGSAQTVVAIPLRDPDDVGFFPTEGPCAYLVIDKATGLGGWNAKGGARTSQLEALIDRLPLGLAMTDIDGRLLSANPAFKRAVGLEDGVLPPYPTDLVIRADKSAIADAVRRFAQGVASKGTVAVRLLGNPAEPISLGLIAVRGLGDGAVLLSLSDSTEETKLKRQVAQATKMQAVGQLAGGVAHDFNNVLTAIIGYCDLMLLRHTPGDSDFDDIQQIKANSNRAASLTRQLLAFSRQQTLQPEVLQLPDVLSEVSQLLKRLLGAKIALGTKHARNLGAVRADPRQLEQVIINLAVNARDAIQSRQGENATGTLTFSTSSMSPDDIRALNSDIIPIGAYTALHAEDTGGGIAPEVLPKMFEPFFTTKEAGKGTGLGLSTVYGIIKQSGGFIFADNVMAPDGTVTGARFTVYLPVYHASPDELRKVEVEEAAGEWSGGGRILLVEDEDMVRAVAERALTRQGYSVVTARDGDEGVDEMRRDPAFDLVVSDVVMPSMDGPAMAREIRKMAPFVPILFMSGYAEETLRQQIDMEAMYFIPKPFSVAQIGAKVGEVLRAQRHLTRG